MPGRRAAAGAASSATHGKNRGHDHHGKDEHGKDAHGHDKHGPHKEHSGPHKEHTGGTHSDGTGGHGHDAPAHHGGGGEVPMGHQKSRPLAPPPEDQAGIGTMSTFPMGRQEPTLGAPHHEERRDDYPPRSDDHIKKFEPPSPSHPEGDDPLGVKMRTNFMDRLRAHADQRNFNPMHGENKIAAKICAHPFFEPFCLFAIVMNALWIGYSTDAEDPDGKEPSFMTVNTDRMFCFWFVVEILIRIGAYKRPLSFFIFDKPNRYWNNFDFGLVVFLVGETVLLPMAQRQGKTSTTDLPALSSMRLLRLLRVARVLRFVPELAMMVRSLVAAIRSVTTTFVLAVGIMYIFAIVFTQWARSHEQKHVPCEPPENCVDAAFGTIARSFLTLFQILCFDATFSLIRAILKERLSYGLLLIVFIVIAAFTVLNMLIGVVCQIVATTSANERSQSMKLEVSKLLKLLEIEDTGFISRKELERNKHVLSELDKSGVDEETIKTALHILDRKIAVQKQQSGKLEEALHLDLEEFMEVIFKLLHPPQTQDILLVQSKLEKLERALGASGQSQGSMMTDTLASKTAEMNEDDDDRHDMDEGTRQAVEKSIWELETQVSSMLDHALEASGRAAPPKEAGWDTELRRLDAAMCRLRVRLERCRDENLAAQAAHCAGGGGEGGMADEAVELASSELQYWRKLCGEVVQSISVASTLMAQAMREAEPDGMFRGEPLFAGQMPGLGMTGAAI